MERRSELKRSLEREIKGIELTLDVKFPQSYRQFLLERGSAEVAGFQILGLPEKEEKEEEGGTLLSFQIGDPRRGFVWVGNYQGRIVGLCSLPDCNLCNLKEREQLKDFRGGELRVNLILHQRATSEFYIAHLVSLPEKDEARKEKPKTSVLGATEILRKRRPDLSEKLVAISFHPLKDKVLCLNTESGVLVETTLKTETKLIPISNSLKEWIEEWKEKENENAKFFPARQRVENRRNEIRERVIRREVDKKFKDKCPVCQRGGRGQYLVCEQCFRGWREETRSEVDLIDWVEEKLEQRKVSLPKFTAKGGKDIHHIHLRPQDWHSWRYAVKDYLVILAAFRWNYTFDCLEVDECWSAIDDPRFPPGEATKALLISLFAQALDFGGSLNLLFTKYIGEDEETGRIVERNWRRILSTLSAELRKEAEEGRGRIHRPIPQELVDLAQRYDVIFSGAEKGKISHQEGVELFVRLFEFPTEARERIDRLEKASYLTKEALCFVLAARIWEREEAIWFFLNVPRPEAIVLGTDVPENRLLYSESMNWGRAVYLAGLLKQKILVDLSGGLSEEERAGIDCQLEPEGEFWILKSGDEFELPWMIKGSEPVRVIQGESVLFLSRPQQTTQSEKDKIWLAEKIEFLAKAESEAEIRCLLLSFEFSDLKYGMKISEEMKEISREAAQKGVNLLFSPFKLDILNDEAEERMAKARRMRRFEPRSAPVKLRLIETPKEVWQEPALRYSVEDTLSAASWIRKKIDLRLGRIRFRTNSQVVERIAIQDPRNKKIAEFDGKESEEILAALRSEQGITLPFVQPEDVPEFVERTGGKIRSALKDVQGGIIAVVPPYEKSAIDSEVKPIEKPIVISVPADFQFPVNPENIGYSRYKQGHRKEEIRRFHEQIQEALKNGQPLAVSYLPHELFPEVIRDYLYYTTYSEYREEPFLFFFKRRKRYERREPQEPVMLRISYQDGTEGEPFPLFCLLEPEPERFPKPTNLFQHKMGSISMRHVNLDLITEGYLMQNIMMRRKGKESAAAQEDYAFRRTGHFLSNFVDLVQHKNVEEITANDKRFQFLWNWLKLEERKYEGLELHIFQTGLEPAVVGMYRAVIEFLRKRRSELVVVPRLISHREWRKQREEKGIKGISEDVYLRTTEWF